MSGRKSAEPASAAAAGIELELPLDLHLRVPNRAYQIATSADSRMGSWSASSRIAERRSSHRIAYHRPMLVTPLDDRTGQPAGTAMLVTARDISLSGISFTHGDPLSCRCVVCTFEPHEDEAPESVVVRLTWCRFTRHGNYQSGGKFIKLVKPVLDPGIEWPRV